TDAGAVEDAERTGHQRRARDGVLRDFLAELRARVQRAVLVVLPRDAGHDFLQLLVAHAVLLAVGRRQQAERRRRREPRPRAVADGVAAGQPREAGVLQLLDTDGHGHVVGTGRDRIAGVAECFGAGRAVVLQPADGLVVDLQRPRQRETALTGEER